MLDLGSTDFYLAVPNVPATDLKRLSSSLFDSWEEYVEVALSLRDYSLFLQVEEGSVRGVTKIGAALSVLYMAIGNYGDFVSGVKTIGEQIGSTSEFLTEQARTVFSCPESKATARKRGGALTSLQNLFVKVQRGELTPDEAAARAAAMLGTESESAPGFLHDLGEAFRSCPRHHEQQTLPFVDDQDAPRSELPDSPQRQRSPRSPIVLGPVLQLRIEVWRDSKNKRKQTRVSKL